MLYVEIPDLADRLKLFHEHVKKTNQFNKNDSQNILVSVQELLKCCGELLFAYSFDPKNNNKQLKSLRDVLWYLTNIQLLKSGYDFKFSTVETKCKTKANYQNLLLSFQQRIDELASNMNGNDSQGCKDKLQKLFNLFVSLVNSSEIDFVKVLITDSNDIGSFKYLETVNRLKEENGNSNEILPQEIKFIFKTGDDQKNRIFIELKNGEFLQLGDPLTDNSHEVDDYKFHDVFHMSFFAFLGWSPVLRSLMKRKRKSQQNIDEVEDGARATIMEEAISAFVFRKKRDGSLTYSIDSEVKVEFEVLDFIKQAIYGFEVSKVSLQRWQAAIIVGCKIFDELAKSGVNGGVILIDVNSDTPLVFQPLSSLTEQKSNLVTSSKNGTAA